MKTLKKLFCLSLIACSFCFLTGCGNKNNSTSANNDKNVAENTTDKVGNVAEDLADGVGNAVEDLVGTNGFERYEDAHKYFLTKMKEYHPDAKLEIRDIDFEVEHYQDGSKAYEFEVYDVSKSEAGEFLGEFYVDTTTGMIYQELENDQIKEYTGNKTTNSDANKDNTENTNTGNTNTDNTGTSGTSTEGTTTNGTENNTGNTNNSSNTGKATTTP